MSAAEGTITWYIGDVPGCTCGPYWSIAPPPPCPHHTTWLRPGETITLKPLPQTVTINWPGPGGVERPPTPVLTDSDIERIARRVAELLRELP